VEQPLQLSLNLCPEAKKRQKKENKKRKVEKKGSLSGQ